MARSDRGREQALLNASHALRSGLANMGWQVLAAEIDTAAMTARIEIRRSSLSVTFDARNGKATTTREMMASETAAVGRRGDRFLAERVRMRLLGRTSHEGLRSGLRWLSAYIEQNASRPAIHGEARELFRPLLASPTAAHFPRREAR
jgi:hypothetical protein